MIDGDILPNKHRNILSIVNKPKPPTPGEHGGDHIPEQGC